MKAKHYPIAALLAAFIAASSFYMDSVIAPATLAAQAPSQEWFNGLSAERYMTHVFFLASPDMKGRASGSPELELAADYIAGQFREFGLMPGGENNTYFQPFELTTGSEFGPRNSIQIDGAPLRINTDFVPISISPTADFEGPVVFAGYGITAPDLQWDDYKDIDVNGKIVVVFRHEPEELDPNSRFAGTSFTNHASFVNKAINARRHGARGIVFVTDPNNHASEQDAVGPATSGVEPDDMGIISMHATRASLAPVFEKIGRNLSDIQRRMDTDLVPQSFNLANTTGRLSTEVIRIRKRVRNVVAAVTGSDEQLKNEWVVIGAHYDHLGLGDSSSLAPSEIGKPHQGADDNASGTSGVLELARLISANKQLFKRSVLFMTFAGEELGLLGSNQFVNNPTVPLNSIVAMINMDMIGRVTNNRLNVIGVATAANFRPWVEEFNQKVGLNVNYGGSTGGSDHMSFMSKRIPALFFFSGLHVDYHKPSDTPDKINAADATKVLTLAGLMLQRIANSDARQQYTEIPEARPPNAGAGGGNPYGVYFGSVPDFRDDLNGVLFADVRIDSPAGKAGLKAGDLLVEFDGQPIKNLYDFTYALGTKKVGDVVPVVVQRSGQAVKVNVTLEVRQ